MTPWPVLKVIERVEGIRTVAHVGYSLALATYGKEEISSGKSCPIFKQGWREQRKPRDQGSYKVGKVNCFRTPMSKR